MPYAKLNDIQLYYESHGEGSPLVFAHGGGGNHLSWWQQVPAFSGSYRCVTFDHRGFGDSPDRSGGPGADAHVEDLRLLLDQLGIERATLVGQSMGGWTVLGFASQHPERVNGLVLCDTTAGMDDPEVHRAQAALRETVKGNLTQVLTRAYAASFPGREPAKHFLYQQISAFNRQVPSDLLAKLAAARTPVAPIVERRVPVLMIVGDEDALIAPQTMELMARRIPQAKLIRIPGAGHSPYFERPEEFNRALRSFLQEHRIS